MKMMLLLIQQEKVRQPVSNLCEGSSMNSFVVQYPSLLGGGEYRQWSGCMVLRIMQRSQLQDTVRVCPVAVYIYIQLSFKVKYISLVPTSSEHDHSTKQELS